MGQDVALENMIFLRNTRSTKYGAICPYRKSKMSANPIEPETKRRKMTKKSLPKEPKSAPARTVTITYGDQAENHAGMQIIGKFSDVGFNLETLKNAQERFESKGGIAELIDLKAAAKDQKIGESAEDAYILVLRKGVDVILESDFLIMPTAPAPAPVPAPAPCSESTGKSPVCGKADDFLAEQLGLDHDTKAFMYGKVVNKQARHNLCFSESAQEPEYEQKKGRIVAYKDAPILDTVRKNLVALIGPLAENLVAEGNYYYDVSKCGIGFHG